MIPLRTYKFLFSVHIKFKVATVPTSRVLPAALKANGLRNLPSIIHGDVAIDTVEEIIDYIDAKFPTRINKINDPTLNESVDKLTRNFFSKFCFYIKSVSKDSTILTRELHRLDDLLKNTTTRYVYVRLSESDGLWISHDDGDYLFEEVEPFEQSDTEQCEIKVIFHGIPIAYCKTSFFSFVKAPDRTSTIFICNHRTASTDDNPC